MIKPIDLLGLTLDVVGPPENIINAAIERIQQDARCLAELSSKLADENKSWGGIDAKALAEAYMRLRGRVDDFMSGAEDGEYMRKFPPSWYDLGAEYDDTIEFGDTVEAAISENKPLHSPVSHPSGVGPDASGVTHGKDSGERVEGPQPHSRRTS